MCHVKFATILLNFMNTILYMYDDNFMMYAADNSQLMLWLQTLLICSTVADKDVSFYAQCLNNTYVRIGFLKLLWFAC